MLYVSTKTYGQCLFSEFKFLRCGVRVLSFFAYIDGYKLLVIPQSLLETKGGAVKKCVH